MVTKKRRPMPSLRPHRVIVDESVRDRTMRDSHRAAKPMQGARAVGSFFRVEARELLGRHQHDFNGRHLGHAGQSLQALVDFGIVLFEFGMCFEEILVVGARDSIGFRERFEPLQLVREPIRAVAPVAADVVG